LDEIPGALASERITQSVLSTASVQLCVVRDSPSEVNLTAQLDGRGIPYEVNRYRTMALAREAYDEGSCDVYVLPTAVLASERNLLQNPNSHQLTPLQETPIRISYPKIEGFNFVGGAKMTAEFTALLIGLVLNTGASVAEIVRAGILSVSKGQSEAARALGLSEAQRLRLVVLPQALRVVIPPQTSQYLNLAKNSTLALAIAYPDFWNIANTTINQSGRAIQIMLIVMSAYLILSLIISAILNWYNQRIALVER
jgi:ABC-type amino acid transport system permease subunit